jgi:DDE superfamily endonuclease
MLSSTTTGMLAIIPSTQVSAALVAFALLSVFLAFSYRMIIGGNESAMNLRGDESLFATFRERGANLSEHLACEVPRIHLLKLSEKGRRSLQCSLTNHRNDTFRPTLASSHLPNPRSERCSYPFSDSLSALDFSHLRAKGVGYVGHQSPLKEVIEVRTLPPKMVQVLAPFAPLFSKRVWQHAQLLLMGAILAPGRRTVSSALRAMGLDHEERFHRYHRVLSRARWSSLEASRILLGLLLEAFVGKGPLILGVDETLERRYGKKISAKGVYRDPVRSTHEEFVKSSGLRWVCVMLLTPHRSGLLRSVNG